MIRSGWALLFASVVLVTQAAGWAQTQRVADDLLVLYLFDEGQGNVVRDQSGHASPLDLQIADPNKVRWSSGFLTLQNETLLRSAVPATRVIEAVQKSQSLSLEVWCKPASLEQAGPARILSLSADPSFRNLTLGQQAQAAEVRLRTTQTSTNGLPGISTPASRLRMELMHLVYTRAAGGQATLYIDGQPQVEGRVPGALDNWDASYPLLMGNEANGGRGWLGELHVAAVYGRCLSPAEVQQNFNARVDERERLAKLLPPAVDRQVDFVAEVQPILRKHCFECHATGNEEGGLNLALAARVWEGGEHGPVLRRGDSLVSSLVHLIAGLDADRIMPPDDHPPLSREQIGIVRAWIDQGAPWPTGADVPDPRLERAKQHWAFQPLKTVAPPPMRDGNVWARTHIDGFVGEKLMERRISASPAAHPVTLVRRLYMDLTGLPPTPEQADAFVSGFGTPDYLAPADDLIQQLLDSPHYGERWGRHWLDLVRYADSDGQESDRDRPEAYRYRDFVIRAFNADMPYDQFVRLQIAGDEYEPQSDEAVIATGFLTAGTHSELGDTFLEEERLFNRYNELDDVVSTLGTSLLGLTVGCARCHDHKYDAFSAREYYRLLAAFHSGDRVRGELPSGAKGLFFRDFDAQPRTSWLFRRGDFYDRELQVQLGFPAILLTGRTAEDYWAASRNLGGVVPHSTLQRRALADWITDVEHGAGALLARVMVNRVWQHHFGYGLVRTPSDFGVRSEAPSHPELLEFLASDFVEHGWSLKRLHRQILNSAVWQQSSRKSNHASVIAAARSNAAIDPDNRLLWKMTPQRLEAEILRDAMLAVSGTLNLEPFGPGFKPYIPPEANLARNLKDGGYPNDVKESAATRRRSVYMFHKRLVPYPLFQAFDRPDLLVSCARRQNTTVATQGMALLNDRFVRSCAEDFATRLIKETQQDTAELVHRSFRLALIREPTASERQAATAFIEGQTKVRTERQEPDARHQAVTDYCQSLFGLDEFIYVE